MQIIISYDDDITNHHTKFELDSLKHNLEVIPSLKMDQNGGGGFRELGGRIFFLSNMQSGSSQQITIPNFNSIAHSVWETSQNET